MVRQFLKNHIAQFKFPVSSLTNDSITLMNNKYAVLTANSLGDRKLLTSNALYNNGLLFTLDRKLDYFPMSSSTSGTTTTSTASTTSLTTTASMCSTMPRACLVRLSTA